MKRMLLLNDDELLILVAWAEVARSASELGMRVPAEIIAHDFNEEDEAVLAKVEEIRPR